MVSGIGTSFMSGTAGISANLWNARQNDALSAQMEDIEGSKVRENMVRSTVKKLTEMEQEERQEEFKSTIKLGEGWVKSLG